ncbi:MAG: hypothetical protein AAGK78_14745, partial [Planctomycetota bacterium]
GRDGLALAADDYEDYLRKHLRGLGFAPMAFMSAKEGTNVEGVLDLAFEMAEQGRERIGTGPLNRLLSSIIETRGTTSKLGTQAKIYYAAQTGTRPPTITLVVNDTKLFSPMYQRFLMNRFREELPFGEVPIRLRIKPRTRGKGRPRTFETAEATASHEAAAAGPSDLEAADMVAPSESDLVFGDLDWAEETLDADSLFEDD